MTENNTGEKPVKINQQFQITIEAEGKDGDGIARVIKVDEEKGIAIQGEKGFVIVVKNKGVPKKKYLIEIRKVLGTLALFNISVCFWE